MKQKSLIIRLSLLAAFLFWSVPAGVLAEEGQIELPGSDEDHPVLDPQGLGADPQTFDVEVWNGPVVQTTPDTDYQTGIWNRFLTALEEMMQRIWEISSPR